MIKSLAAVIVICVLLVLAGCKQDQDHTALSPYLYDYAPVNVGHSVTYDVDSVRYNYLGGAAQEVDTIHYQIKELVQDTFYDVMGKVNYRLEVFKRFDTMQPFVLIDRAWYALRTTSTYEKVEDDLHFVKLVFPPVAGITWKGNKYLPASDTISDMYQPFADWVYTYTSVNKPADVNGQHFDSTVVVTEVFNQNLINDEVSRETYALHIGLIYKEWELIDKQDVSSGWDNPNQANGFRIRMRIHSYTP